MEYFHSIKDSDIFENPFPEPESYTERPTAKGFVIDDEGKIALLNVHEGILFGLPGGGIEEKETPEQAFIRECEEEVGCTVEIIAKIGTVQQTRNGSAKKYIIHYFVAKVVGEKGTPTTTEEAEKRVEFSWYSEEEVESLLGKQIPNISNGEYPHNFNARTHLVAFEKYLEMKK